MIFQNRLYIKNNILIMRINVFHQIHQALRALLYHVSITVQHTDFTQPEQTTKTVGLIREMVNFFEGHAHTEDSLVFPMIAKFAPEVVADFEKQHVTDHALGEELKRSIDNCMQAATHDSKIQAGIRLQRAVNAFTAFNLTHMGKEETEVLPLIHKHYTDEQILEKEKEIVQSLSDEKKAFSGYWMLKGLAMHEIIHWFQQIQATVPSFVLDQYLQLAERALSEDKFKKLQESLAVSLI
jgi:hemerythrin-like domain-containing protein